MSITNLPPLPFAVPLLAAALLAGGGKRWRRGWADAVSITTAMGVSVACFVLLQRSFQGLIVYWFGGWTPRQGVALGVSFAIDPVGAGLAMLAGVLVTAAFVFSTRFFDAVGTLYHALMLVFLAAMCGFCLSGDLFNMFVFFELMSVAAYALTAYKSEEAQPLEGGLNFAITNSIGAFLVLIGIALLYGRTGALNLAQIGIALAGHPADGLVLVAFVLLAAGFFVKAAIVPFHLWLDDAHAVAPTPVCVLFSGVMVALGLFGFARIYWTTFSGPLGSHEPATRAILLGAGALTVVLGGVMCFAQRHLKRLLAFSTMTHMGMLLVGIALLNAKGLAGVALYACAHGLVKAGLFLCAGILLNRFSSVDEIDLRGRGHDMKFSGALFLIAGLGLAGCPPFMTSIGKSVIESAARESGFPWVPGLFFLGSVLTAGATLRAAGRIYLGWGPEPGMEADGPHSQETKEIKASYKNPPWVLILPAAVLLAGAVAVGLSHEFTHHAGAAAQRFVDRRAYAAATLRLPSPPPAPTLVVAEDTEGRLWALASALGAVALALVSLFRHRLPQGLLSGLGRVTGPILGALRDVHSGQFSDYVTWVIVGAAILGVLFAVMTGAQW